VEWEQQQSVIHQMERHSRDQVYFLFLYDPIQLYTVNKAVQFVPYVSPLLNLSETSVTEHHWSVRTRNPAADSTTNSRMGEDRCSTMHVAPLR
jgi:hypothetical protein